MIKKTLFKLICMGVSVLVITTGAQAGVSLNLQDQRYDIELFLSDVNLKTVVNSLKSQTDIVFSYDVDMETLPVNSVSVKAENEPIENILDKVFSGTHVKYKLDENIITLFIEKKTEVNQPRIQQSNTKRITGTITDEKGEPVIGANVVVKGTTNGVITNMDGEFALDVPQDAFCRLAISVIWRRRFLSATVPLL
ncbi:MAG: carboxypeptidase-like regulatory domain-containing protein [Tannerellaceae bacterium]|nr:carboxypeptidase-like regulatory domain-containing protein [Tannerellaceae bacterium]